MILVVGFFETWGHYCHGSLLFFSNAVPDTPEAKINTRNRSPLHLLSYYADVSNTSNLYDPHGIIALKTPSSPRSLVRREAIYVRSACPV